MKRYFANRYPMYGYDHEGIGAWTMRIGVVVTIFSGILTYRKWSSTQDKRRDLEQEYKPLDPNSVVPLAKDIVPIDHGKLRRAVLEGDDFIMEELGIKIISSPEEFVYYRTKGIQDKEAFLKFLRGKFNNLQREKHK